MGLPWDWKAGGWKRGLPGPGEKGRRGLAVVLAGIRGEALAPGKKMGESGFTRPEVLRGRKEDKASQRQGVAAGSTLTRPPGHTAGSYYAHPFPESNQQTQKEHPQTLRSCFPVLPSPGPAPRPPHIPFITLWSPQEDGQGHLAGAGCYPPKRSHGTRGLWTQPSGRGLGPVQSGTGRSLLWGQERWLGPQELGREAAAGPGNCLQRVLRPGQEARLRGCRKHSRAWGCRSPGPAAHSARRRK